jgi:hypothetical protein
MEHLLVIHLSENNLPALDGASERGGKKIAEAGI